MLDGHVIDSRSVEEIEYDQNTMNLILKELKKLWQYCWG